MIKLHDNGVFIINGREIVSSSEEASSRLGMDVTVDKARKGTISYSILQSHSVSGDDKHLKIKYDSMTSHDITYVGIIQSARASGMKEFPLPYVLTNCHNSLCAVGGTINEDDHKFASVLLTNTAGSMFPQILPTSTAITVR